MRKNIVAGNWKMNMNLLEGLALAKEVSELVEKDANNGVEVVLGTPFIHLSEVNKAVNKAKIKIAAQNCAKEVSGAYTGEISAEMIKSTSSDYIILGHSERRAYYGDTDAILTEKVNRSLENDMKVIFCIGEILSERESENHFNVVKSQLDNGVFHLSAEVFKNIVLAYEPVWAIGTGVTASSDQAQEMHAFIRETLVEKYGETVAEDTSILYGGSCKPSNAKELFANKDVDGGLIGGAALKAEDFMGIITAF
jgi:triosephosphate isomerase